LNGLGNPEKGLTEAIAEIVTSIVFGAIVAAIGSSFPSMSFYIALINIALIFAFVITTTKWGVLYTFGWLGGAIIFFGAGLLEPIDFFIYIVVPIGLLVIKYFLWIREENSTYSIIR
jgi:hypothetical protein